MILKERVFFYVSFLICFLFFPLFSTEVIELTAEKFAIIVSLKSPNTLIDEISPFMQEAIYVEDYKRHFHSKIDIDYKENMAARKETQQSNSRNLSTAWSYRLPPVGTIIGSRLGINKTEKKKMPNGMGGTSDSKMWNANVGFFVSQPLLLGLIHLKPQLELKAQDYNLQIEHSAYNRKLAKNIEQALRIYYEYLIDLKKINLFKSNLEKKKKVVAFNKKKVIKKIFKKKDYLLSKAGLLQDELDVQDAEKKLDKLRDQLLMYMGYDIEKYPAISIKILDKETAFEQTIEAKAEESFQKALNHRNDIIIAKMAVNAAKNGVKISKASIWPKLDANFGFYLNGNKDTLSGAFKNIGSKDSAQGIDLQWGLQFSAATDIASYKILGAKADLKLLQAKRELDKLKKEIFIDIKKKVSDLLFSKDRLDAISLMVKLREDRYKITQEDYSNGKIDFYQKMTDEIELKKIQKSFFDAQKGFFNAILSYHAAQGTICQKYLEQKVKTRKKPKLKNVLKFIDSQKK